MSEEEYTPQEPEPAPQPAPQAASERPEDQVDQSREKGFAPLSAPEVPLEESRKDESSSLATDRYDSEGNRIN